MKVYAGIGSRRASPQILNIIYDIGYKLASLGWVLRSGGADGCDTAFQDAVTEYAYGNDYEMNSGGILPRKLQEIYIPWNEFNNLQANEEDGIYIIENPKADELAKKYHPAYNRLSKAAKKLMARNCHQILGENLDDPCRMVICYTPDGAVTETSRETGGTGQALRVAIDHDIPVYNLAYAEHFHRLKAWLEEDKI